METKIKNVGQMKIINNSTPKQLNTSTSDGIAIRKDYFFTFEKLEVWQLAKKLCNKNLNTAD
ncbi:MAG: hypothetical protein KAT65_06450 [Methanophagales archaeon]|nr:hypothetical protein [Methanophagales archaeon]